MTFLVKLSADQEGERTNLEPLISSASSGLSDVLLCTLSLRERNLRLVEFKSHIEGRITSDRDRQDLSSLQFSTCLRKNT